MPVFDFNNSPQDGKDPECTYEIFYSSESETSAEHPILVLDNTSYFAAYISCRFLDIQQ